MQGAVVSILLRPENAAMLLTGRPRPGGASLSKPRERWAPAVSLAGLLAAIVLFVALVYGLGADSYLFRAYDVREVLLHHRAYYRTALAAGRLPLWTPHTFSGWPFAANPLTETFYPPRVVGLVLPEPAGFVAELLFHLTLAAFGTYLLLRRSFSLSEGAATFGALVFALSGPFVGHAFAGHVPLYAACAYLPWVLLALDRTVAGSTARERRLLARVGVWPWIGSIVLGLQILSGGLPFVWLTLLVAGLYGLGDTLVRAPGSARAWIHEAAVLGFVGAVAAGLAAVQLLPTYELARLSNRAHAGWDYAAVGSLPPSLLPALALPTFGAEDEELFWEYYGYVGILPLLLAVASLTLVRRERRLAVLWAIGALALLFALGSHSFVFPFLWRHVPGFDAFRAPARALIAVALVLAASAAVGLDALLARVRRRSLVSLLAAVACAVTLLDVTLAARHNRPRLFLPDDEPKHPVLADTLRGDRAWYRYWFGRNVFTENAAYTVRARSISGYDNLILARYERFVHHMTDTPIDTSLVTHLHPATLENAPSPFPFKILGEKYSTYGLRLRRRDAADPVRRAWFVTRARRVADEAAALAHMRSDAFAPYEEVVLETPEADQLQVPPPLEDATPRPEVEVVEQSPERLRIRVGPHPAGFLVVSEMFYPGWRARVGTREVPIYRADSILRCVPLAAEDTEVEMVYAPRTLAWGMAISVGTAAIAAAGLVLAGRR